MGVRYILKTINTEYQRKTKLFRVKKYNLEMREISRIILFACADSRLRENRKFYDLSTNRVYAIRDVKTLRAFI